jgi:hypothetical protein
MTTTITKSRSPKQIRYAREENHISKKKDKTKVKKKGEKWRMIKKTKHERGEGGDNKILKKLKMSE